ncbi:Penicillin-binding protein 1A [Vibrio stylophorae]|uniref:Penicillin-binding protein 1A n=1 Tax=Vibrio stylophorae TaxID=659351 RepID=A0ABM8ZW65_9VIBR|nr:PBP1A family penicillin-binding protein [Vibrio stylophorae]CAH0534596.1 Penicillin-binding protein 1A [Vibrio stylophorae]
MKFIKRFLLFAVFCMILGLGTIFGFYLYLKPELPDVATIKDVQLQTPLQILSADGKLIAQFGDKRRNPLTLDQIPQQMIDAFIATEDSRFYDHPGIDPIGITRAALVVLKSGHAKEGASTITQQLARNYFLSSDKKLMRKIKEMYIAIHLEQLLTKQEILELYLNKIYLGQRAYGVGAAAQVYFSKQIQDLTLSEIAIIAGLPKAPSTMNPIYSIDRATTRRNVVLGRMLAEGYITQAQFDAAVAEPIVSRYHGADIELNSPYAAEMARLWAIEQYGEDVQSSGYRVFTTINSTYQEAANTATVDAVIAYDLRHGYRGAAAEAWTEEEPAWDQAKIAKYVAKQPSYGILKPAVVLSVDKKSATIQMDHNAIVEIPWDGMKWARRYVSAYSQRNPPTKASQILTAGELIYVRKYEDIWFLSQVPAVQTAFVSINPMDGGITSLVGGFNFHHNQFNRATMSVRQVGSSIKPFIYAAALDNGMTLATIVNDAPISAWDESMGVAWRPTNSPNVYDGPTRFRIGLARSKNVMAVRVLRHTGLDKTVEYLKNFGFNDKNLPKQEAIALGAGSLTPLELAQGYAVFANGGFYVKPYLIARVEDPFGKEIYQANPSRVCKSKCAKTNAEGEVINYAPRVISEKVAFLTREMLISNIWGGKGWKGTGWRAKVLNRKDIGGKTGTTNDVKDAWYAGFGPGIAAVAWVGFDDNNKELGFARDNNNIRKEKYYTAGGEGGGKTAIPIWIDFMKVALADVPKKNKIVPYGITRVRIDRATGKLSDAQDGSSILEYFISGTQPTVSVSETGSGGIYGGDSATDSIF